MFHSVDSTNELKLVELFVRDDFFNCPYLYANLMKYGIENENTKLYAYTTGDELKAVAFLYYDCLHVYYRSDFRDFDEVHALIAETDPRTIFFPSYSEIEFQQLEGYTGKEVLVMAPMRFTDIDISKVKSAKHEDLHRIADFLFTQWPDIYDSAESIYTQMEERMLDHYGRTKYYEDDGEIVATVSSFAELDDFAICGGLLVSPSQRGKNLGSVMLKSVYQELDQEGKNPCGIIVEDYSQIFHEKNGFGIVGRIIKYNQIV